MDRTLCRPRPKGGRHEFKGAGSIQCVGGNTVKTQKFEKGGGCMTPPPPSMVAPPLPRPTILEIILVAYVAYNNTTGLRF